MAGCFGLAASAIGRLATRARANASATHCLALWPRSSRPQGGGGSHATSDLVTAVASSVSATLHVTPDAHTGAM